MFGFRKEYPPSTFKTGDLVQLKLGGPKMLVEIAYCDIDTLVPMARCYWFDAKQHLHCQWIREALLTEAKPV